MLGLHIDKHLILTRYTYRRYLLIPFDKFDYMSSVIFTSISSRFLDKIPEYSCPEQMSHGTNSNIIGALIDPQICRFRDRVGQPG